MLPWVVKRFGERYEVAESGCWLWSHKLDDDGYGRIDRTLAHRVAYEVHVGPIPNGLQIDHLCRVRRCVNPAHLEAVTPLENSRRTPRALATECQRGHPFNAANTYRDRGRRACRACGALSARRYQERKRIAAGRADA